MIWANPCAWLLRLCAHITTESILGEIWGTHQMILRRRMRKELYHILHRQNYEHWERNMRPPFQKAIIWPIYIYFLCYMLAGKSTQFTNSCWADSEQSFKKEAASCLSSLPDEGNCQTKHQTNGVVFLKQSCNFPSKSAILIQTHNGKRANVYCMWRWCHLSSDGYFESVA